MSNVRCEAPGDLRLTITHAGRSVRDRHRFDWCAPQRSPWARLLLALINSGFRPLSLSSELQTLAPLRAMFGAPRAKRSRIHQRHCQGALSQHLISHSTCWRGFRRRVSASSLAISAILLDLMKSTREVYRAARAVADQVIYMGEHSHRSKATGRGYSRGAVCSLRGGRGGSEISEGDGHARRAHPFEGRRQSAS